MGGTLIQPISSVTVQGLPLDIPTEFVLDISVLDGFEKSILLSDLETDEAITLMNPEDQMLARVLPPRVEEEPTVGTEEGEEGEEGIEGEEGAAELGEGQEPGEAEQQDETK